MAAEHLCGLSRDGWVGCGACDLSLECRAGRVTEVCAWSSSEFVRSRVFGGGWGGVASGP